MATHVAEAEDQDRPLNQEAEGQRQQQQQQYQQLQQQAPPQVRPLAVLREELRSARAAYANALFAHRSNVSAALVFGNDGGADVTGHDRIEGREELQALNDVAGAGGFASAVDKLPVPPDLIEKMVHRTGFSEEECRCSLEHTSCNVEAAVDLLLQLGGTV
jgi:hypothetical protein